MGFSTPAQVAASTSNAPSASIVLIIIIKVVCHWAQLYGEVFYLVVMKNWNCCLLHVSLIVKYESDLAWITSMNQCEEGFLVTFSPKGTYQRRTPFHTLHGKVIVFLEACMWFSYGEESFVIFFVPLFR
jgi:hypothetical protein